MNIGLALVGVIVGEFQSADLGLGFLIMNGSQIFKLNIVMTAITLLALISSVMYLAIYRLEATVARAATPEEHPHHGISQWVIDRVQARQGCLHPYDSLPGPRTAAVVIDTAALLHPARLPGRMRGRAPSCSLSTGCAPR